MSLKNIGKITLGVSIEKDLLKLLKLEGNNRKLSLKVIE
jgi:hypothetical protein